jgi:uncharacterized protein YeaO (DUF488 family)
MSIFIVQLGTPRESGEGLRLGTVRRPPRGVPKSDFARLDYYDVWFPNLSPSAELVQEALRATDEQAWAAFSRKFRREMSAPDRSRADQLGGRTWVLDVEQPEQPANNFQQKNFLLFRDGK